MNDTHGHLAGVLLLQMVARRIEECVRLEDTAARIAGDEFVVLCEGLDGQHAQTVAARVVTSLAQPFDLELQQIRLGASVGLALGRAGDTASDILRRADAAMYVAKQRGRSRFELAR